jgi:hypothetical protein
MRYIRYLMRSERCLTRAQRCFDEMSKSNNAVNLGTTLARLISSSRCRVRSQSNPQLITSNVSAQLWQKIQALFRGGIRPRYCPTHRVVAWTALLTFRHKHNVGVIIWYTMSRESTAIHYLFKWPKVSVLTNALERLYAVLILSIFSFSSSSTSSSSSTVPSSSIAYSTSVAYRSTNNRTVLVVVPQ